MVEFLIFNWSQNNCDSGWDVHLNVVGPVHPRVLDDRIGSGVVVHKPIYTSEFGRV